MPRIPDYHRGLIPQEMHIPRVYAMASASQFRRIALALDGVTETPHFDRAAFKVARIFATLAADGRSFNLMLEPDEQEFKCMAAPDVFTPVPGGWGRQGWTTVSLAKIGVPELKQSLELAWRHALPKSRKSPVKTRAVRRD